jgi:threonyl-tRNA synthetase
MSNPPEYWDYRIKVWDQIKHLRDEERSKLPETPITITLPNGSTKEGIKGKTTPMDIALSISKGLAKQVVVAKVNDQLHDLSRPFEGDSTLTLLKFDSEEAKTVFWHSSSHVLGESLEHNFKVILAKGPPIEGGGFFYDVLLPEGGKSSITNDDYESIEKFVKTEILQKGQVFERLVISKEEALEMFKYNKYKVDTITNKVPDGGFTTAYKCGPLIDLCKGPHIPSTDLIKGFKVTKNSSSYWKNDAKNDSLQRVYGISFPTQKELDEYVKMMADREKRDHRNIGRDQELFFFHPLSPGSCFFLPRGTKIYNKLIEFIRNEYRVRGFTEVITPNIYNKELWVTSGHWENYEENMFSFKCDEQTFCLKPMNCPGHCLAYKALHRSYRELPLRFAEFGVLHRNELHGALTGLTRVRRFQQDDCHIFCRPDQIVTEISNALEFLRSVYGVFGFDFTLELSTRPKEKFLGTLEMWENAEKSLENALKIFCGDNWKLNPGDGAFYGPKIDIHVLDVMKRSHQCATIQLDFNLPERFDLEFDAESEGKRIRPVIIHRAIYGSLERFIGILIEHTGGKWPLWLSPRQVMICTIRKDVESYAEKVKQTLFEAGFDVEMDSSDLTINKKVRKYQLSQFNYILVVGKDEAEKGTVNVRIRDEKQERGELTISALLDELKEKVKKFQ